MVGAAASTSSSQPPAVSREPLVSACDLSVGYSDQPVCAPATFELLPGQVLALVGVNGAGKSTILRTCCGLLRPLAGRVHVPGHVPDPRSGAQRAALATDLGQEVLLPHPDRRRAPANGLLRARCRRGRRAGQ